LDKAALASVAVTLLIVTLAVVLFVTWKTWVTVLPAATLPIFAIAGVIETVGATTPVPTI